MAQARARPTGLQVPAFDFLGWHFERLKFQQFPFQIKHKMTRIFLCVI